MRAVRSSNLPGVRVPVLINIAKIDPRVGDGPLAKFDKLMMLVDALHSLSVQV